MSPTTVEVLAPAKVNLTLHVTGQRADGYHLLDSLVTFAGIGDRITAVVADETSLTVTGPFAGDLLGGDNLVLRAADAMQVTAAITLEKNLPVASGLGGGSADAAATLHALARLSGRPLPILGDQARLGADVPACAEGQLLRMGGIGEDLSLMGKPPRLPMLLVNPGVAVSTPAVFAKLTEKVNAPMPLVIPDSGLLDWLAGQRNDLQAPAIEVAPVIGDVLTCLERSGARLARMSGSGATCFALYDTDAAATEARDTITDQHPDWWCQIATP